MFYGGALVPRTYHLMWMWSSGMLLPMDRVRLTTGPAADCMTVFLARHPDFWPRLIDLALSTVTAPRGGRNHAASAEERLSEDKRLCQA